MKNNLILKLEFDGTNYNGWQSQINGNTIQNKIELALYKVFKQKLKLIGAGRTDSGVHSSEFIANTILEKQINIDENKIPIAINSYLPDDIRIIESKLISKNFNARYSAIARQYGYYIHLIPSVFLNRYSTFVKYKLNIDLLLNSAGLFLGEHNFIAFSKKNEDTKNYICKVEQSYWTKIDDYKFKFTIKSDRFVYGMVRAIVGTMIDIARKKKSFDEIQKSFKSCNRENISPLAPPQGLFLEKIYYPKDLDFFNSS